MSSGFQAAVPQTVTTSDNSQQGDDKKKSKKEDKVDTGVIPEHVLEIATMVKECERETGTDKSDADAKHRYKLNLKTHVLEELKDDDDKDDKKKKDSDKK